MSWIAFDAAPAAAAGPTCGAVVVKSITLRANLTNCPGDGLVVGGNREPAVGIDGDDNVITGNRAGAQRHGASASAAIAIRSWPTS